MAFVALLSRDRGLRNLLERSVPSCHSIAGTPSWGGLARTVRERPVTLAVLDAGAVPAGASPGGAVAEFRTAFPNLGLILVAPRQADPVRLFHLGRAGIPHLILLPVESLDRELPRAIGKARERDVSAVVMRALSPYLPARETEAVRLALEGVHRRWTAEEFAAAAGFSRPFLSERLKACSLPSAGHLLIWARLLYAGWWLEEPGRTAESVSRQLEYSSGAAFRRALKLYTGATPTQVIRRGGLAFVLSRFLDACGAGHDKNRFTAA